MGSWISSTNLELVRRRRPRPEDSGVSEETSEAVLAAWRESAQYWERHREKIRVMFAPVTRAIIEDARIVPGQSVLDVAGGAGEPSLTVAEIVGPAGSVTCTDAVSEMIVAAERAAHRRNLRSIEFRRCAAEALSFADDSFDAVTCRFGAMFFSDPPTALREMLRVTKPGCRLSFAVWGDRQCNPFFGIVTEIISRYIDSPSEDPNAPGAFRFATAGILAALLKAAGAIDVSERVLDFRIRASIGLEQFWPLRVEMSDTLREKVAKLSAEQLSQIPQEVQQAVRGFFRKDEMDFPAQAILVTGRKADHLASCATGGVRR